MLSFSQLFALSAIAMALGEGTPHQAAAIKDTQLETPSRGLQLDGSGQQAPSKGATMPAAQPASSEAASAAATGVQAPQVLTDASGSKVAEVPPASQVEGTMEEHDEASMVQVGMEHSLAQNQADIDNQLLATLPFCAVLLSFVGVVSFTIFFLYRIRCGRTKSKSQVSKGAAGKPSLSNNHEELDFEDLETALNMTVATHVSRKQVGGGGLEEKLEVLKKGREAGSPTNCSETTTPPSDDGWGSGAWADDGWDSLDDCEEDLNAVDASISTSAPPSTPKVPALRKGKAD